MRPHLEYCAPAWKPYLKKDIELYKSAEKSLKMIKGFTYLSYEERLRRTRMTTLEKTGDLIETYKIITGKVDIDPGKFFEATRDARTRGHQYKLYKRTSGYFSNRFFSARVADSWNKLI